MYISNTFANTPVVAALTSRSKYLLFLCTVVQNTGCSRSRVPLISPFASRFCWQLPQDWKPEMVSAENLMAVMESSLMETHRGLRLPASWSVLQHRWYLIPFAPQSYILLCDTILWRNKRRAAACFEDEMKEREEKMVQKLYTDW